eukprot:2953356-Lingulodinium_polyedra.AAC.1
MAMRRPRPRLPIPRPLPGQTRPSPLNYEAYGCRDDSRPWRVFFLEVPSRFIVARCIAFGH